MSTSIQLELEPTPNDGVVLTNKFRTMRLKQPTVDLIYVDGKLNAIENGVVITIADGAQEMEGDMVYEMDVIKSENGDEIKLAKPRPRALKKMPNSMDVVKRAIATATRDPSTNTVLLDITSMSFSISERVYQMAQARAPSNRKVIVIFSAGRFWEWKQMKYAGFSYIAIEIDVTT